MVLRALLTCFRGPFQNENLSRPPGHIGKTQTVTPINVSTCEPNELQPSTLPEADDSANTSSKLGQSFALITSSRPLRVPLASESFEPVSRRDEMICAVMPAAVTVFDEYGRVMHQNLASTRYLGERVSHYSVQPDMLAAIFQLEPDNLHCMLRDICRESGSVWRGLVRVPSTLAARVGDFSDTSPALTTSCYKRPEFSSSAVPAEILGKPDECLRRIPYITRANICTSDANLVGTAAGDVTIKPAAARELPAQVPTLSRDKEVQGGCAPASVMRATAAAAQQREAQCADGVAPMAHRFSVAAPPPPRSRASCQQPLETADAAAQPTDTASGDVLRMLRSYMGTNSAVLPSASNCIETSSAVGPANCTSMATTMAVAMPASSDCASALSTPKGKDLRFLERTFDQGNTTTTGTSTLSCAINGFGLPAADGLRIYESNPSTVRRPRLLQQQPPHSESLAASEFPAHASALTACEETFCDAHIPLATSTFGLMLSWPVEAAPNPTPTSTHVVCIKNAASASRSLRNGPVRVLDMASPNLQQAALSSRTMSQELAQDTMMHMMSCASPRAATLALPPSKPRSLSIGVVGSYLPLPQATMSLSHSHAPPSTTATATASIASRALVFASSLRNAPTGAQMLADSSRRRSLQSYFQKPAQSQHQPGLHSRGQEVNSMDFGSSQPPSLPAATGAVACRGPFMASSAAAEAVATQSCAGKVEWRWDGASGGLQMAKAFLWSRASVDVPQVTRLAKVSPPPALAAHTEKSQRTVEIDPTTSLDMPRNPKSTGNGDEGEGTQSISSNCMPLLDSTPACLLRHATLPRAGADAPMARKLSLLRGLQRTSSSRDVGVKMTSLLSQSQQRSKPYAMKGIISGSVRIFNGGEGVPNPAGENSRVADSASAGTSGASQGPNDASMAVNAAGRDCEAGTSGAEPSVERAAPLPVDVKLCQQMEQQCLRGAGGTQAPVQVPTSPVAECWHEVWASWAVDPITGKDVIVLSQHDVSAKVLAERHLALVMEAEHRLLEQLFPKHILTHAMEEWMAVRPEAGSPSAAAVAAGAESREPQNVANDASAATADLTSGAVTSATHPRFRAMSSRRLQVDKRPVVGDCNALATWHPEVTLLFADIKGFTPMCEKVTPREVMTMLNDLFSRFDDMLDRFGVFKVETIGDCYFVAGGLIREDEDGMAAVRDGTSRRDPLHAQKVFMFAKAMLSTARSVRMPSSGESVQLRIGICSGPVVSGVVGTRTPRFCLFGDTVNSTSRMESTGQPGAIHASQSAYTLLRTEKWEATGGIEVKGKGLMQTYLWKPALEDLEIPVPTWPDSTAAAVAALKLCADGASSSCMKYLNNNSTAVSDARMSSGDVAGRCALVASNATANSPLYVRSLESPRGRSQESTGESDGVGRDAPDRKDISDDLASILINLSKEDLIFFKHSKNGYN